MTAETALRVLREFDAHDYAEDYEFCADGDYKPSEQEKTLIEDAILGALGAVEERIRAAFDAREDFEFAGQAALDSAISELDVAAAEIIKAKARKTAIEEAEKATWIGLQPYVDNLTQGKHPELVTFRLLTDIRATIRALAEDKP